MAPRHLAASPHRGRGVALAVALALLAGAAGAALVWWSRDTGSTTAVSPAAGTCDTPALQLAVTPEIRGPVSRILAGAGCTGVTVTTARSAEVARTLLGGEDGPQLWIPDSSLWAYRARPPEGDPPRPLVSSLARTPVVLAAETEPPGSWHAALGDERLVLGDPLRSTSAAAALLLGSQRLGPRESGELIVPLAQQQAEAGGRAPTNLGEQAVGRVRRGRVTPVPEQQALVHGLDPAALSVPRPGTWMLDYPLLLTDPGLAGKAQPVVEALRSQQAERTLAHASFRPSSGALDEPGLEDAVPVRSASRPSGRTLAGALQSWRTLALPTRALTVVDVSGSMDFAGAAGTRIGLTVDAARQGLALFPDAAQVGLWAFSVNLGDGTDYRELAPIRRLDDTSTGRPHRQRLLTRTSTLGSLTDGGTGLYDTALAAYRTVLESYDPDAINSVILLTDGADDDPDSIGRQRLLARLRALRDPARPVSIVTIAITDEADEQTLRAISEATGGYHGVAERPGDIADVFAEALGSRSQQARP